MLRGFKYRIYPDSEQILKIESGINASRFIHNWGLAQKRDGRRHGEHISCFDLINKLPELKRQHPWLLDTDSKSLQQALRVLELIVTDKLKRTGHLPKFKSRRNTRKTYQTVQTVSVNFSARTLSVPKIRNIRIVIDRPFNGKIKNVTISKTPTGKYYASILVDDGKELPEKGVPNGETAVGLDLGLKHFLIDSNGKKIENPKFFRRAYKQIEHHTKSLSKKQLNSSNYKKTKLRIAKLYEKSKNQRRDFLHKLSTQITRENQGGICVENLNIKGLMSNPKLLSHIADAGWGEFIRQLKYKAEWYGKNLLTIGRFEPSSKTCSTCGNVNNVLKLEDREWTCEVCHTTHDRDINAAVNIKNFAFVRDIGREPPELTLVELNNGSTLKQEIQFIPF